MQRVVQQQGQISIALSDNGKNQTTTRTYQGGDILEGFVNIFGSDKSEFGVKISLKGIVRTWATSKEANSFDGYFRTGEHTFLHETQHLQSHNTVVESDVDGVCQRVRFRFVIPDELISARSEVSSKFLHLPPSMRLGHPLTLGLPPRTYMQPLIFYVVIAHLYSAHEGGSITGYSELEFKVKPLAKAQPPLQLSYYPSEFTPTSECVVKRHLWGRSLGRLRISCSEPEALNTAVAAPRATTTAFAKMMFVPRKNCGLMIYPYEWEVTVKYFVKSKTFCSSQVFTKEPLVPDLKSSILELHTETTTPETRRCTSHGWRVDRLSKRGTIESEDEDKPWTTCLKIPINAPKDLLSTCLTTLSARRYSLCLSFHIVGFSHHTVELEVPIQVTHDDFQSKAGSKELLVGNEIASAFSQLSVLHTNLPGIQSSEELPKYSYIL